MLRRWVSACVVLALAACTTQPQSERLDAGSEPLEASGAEAKTFAADWSRPRAKPAEVALPPMQGGSAVILSPSMSSVRPDYRLDHLTPSEEEESVEEEDVEDQPILQQGVASFYGKGFHLRRTANGERFNMYELTAAHPTLPFGTQLCVRNLRNGKTVQVRVNDRGPFTRKRVIDVSQAAAQELGMVQRGIQQVVLYEPKDSDNPCERKDDVDPQG